MTALNKQALREAAQKATKGDWWSDVVETDGEYGEGEDRVSGYHSYAVYAGHESLLDMTNSTAACIHEEWDHDYHMAWDETAKRNAEFIAKANPATVLALLDELEAAEELAELQRFKLERQAEDLHQAKSLEIIHRDKRFEVEREFRDYKDQAERNSMRLAKEVCRLEDELQAAGIGVKGN